jgi:predicted Zn-dependent protease
LGHRLVIAFNGTYFDGHDAKAHPVAVTLHVGLLTIEDDTVSLNFELDECEVATDAGSARHTLYTPDGGRLETTDDEAFSTLEDQCIATIPFRVTHWLEDRWLVIIAVVLSLLLFVFAVTTWGIPQIARMAAFSIPDATLARLGENILDKFDHTYFTVSTLQPSEQERIRSLVDRFTDQTGAPTPGRLLFRNSAAGPNAFSLPGDILVLTDDLVAFTQNDEELLGVVAHELAHLKYRHAVQTALHNAGASYLVMILFGQTHAASSTHHILSVYLLQTHYSRAFEQEADRIASVWMQTAGYGVEPMITFLTRMAQRADRAQEPEFFSTHPTLENRISALHAIANESRD